MRYIDRRFLLPVAAATAWAQQPAPEAAAAEAALRARVEQFFQLQVDKKFRQAESLVAEDSKDGYYEANKYNIKSFRIDKVEFLDGGGTRARVTIKAKVTIIAPAAGVFDLDAPSTSLWKLENGQWSYYLDKKDGLETPFGKIVPPGASTAPPLPPNPGGKVPDFSSMMKLVKLDRTAVVLTPGTPTQTVTVSNELPGEVDLEVGNNGQQGFSVEVDKKHLEAGEKTGVHITAKKDGEAKAVVRINVLPLNIALDIRVTQE